MCRLPNEKVLEIIKNLGEQHVSDFLVLVEVDVAGWKTQLLLVAVASSSGQG